MSYRLSFSQSLSNYFSGSLHIMYVFFHFWSFPGCPFMYIDSTVVSFHCFGIFHTKWNVLPFHHPLLTILLPIQVSPAFLVFDSLCIMFKKLKWGVKHEKNARSRYFFTIIWKIIVQIYLISTKKFFAKKQITIKNILWNLILKDITKHYAPTPNHPHPAPPTQDIFYPPLPSHH